MTSSAAWRARFALLAAMAAIAVACHDPDAAPLPTPPVHVSEHVLEHLAPGGRVRRVVYEPPPALAHPDSGEMSLPFPGPGVDAAPPSVDSPGPRPTAVPPDPNLVPDTTPR